MSKNIVAANSNNFKQEVLDPQQPVLVDFWATWCAPCRQLNPIIENIAEQYQGNVRVVKVNVDENPDIAQEYRIKGIPTLLLFKGGAEEERIVGAVPQGNIADLLDRHITARV